MSLRTRLVVSAAAAVAIAIILASALIYILIRGELYSQIDQGLKVNAASTPAPREAGLVAPHVYQLYSIGRPLFGYYQLVDASGNVFVPEDYIPRVGNPTAEVLKVTSEAEAVAAGKSPAGYYDTQYLGQHVRVYTMPDELLTGSSAGPGLAINKRYALQVVASLSGIDHELAKIELWLFLVALGGVGLASGAGLIVARSTLRPVRDLSAAAERVRQTRDLTQRITVAGSDELSQLAVTFNAMLEALDDAAKRQRQLVQDASHELRTPLTSLRTNIEVLANGGMLPPEERRQLLHDVIAQLGELTALVSELTELARGEEQAAAAEDVRLDLVAEDAIKRTIRNYPDVSIEAELSPATVSGTPAALERAIGNLLDNAAKWSPPGSPIEVSVDVGELTVRDHGPGIAPADAPHIFERFYRATSARSMPGSGLGLSIVHRVAEAHGGTITAEPASGGGTLMRLSLPPATVKSDSAELAPDGGETFGATAAPDPRGEDDARDGEAQDPARALTRAPGADET
jgi:two-component system sensor histidine kinase MprB